VVDVLAPSMTSGRVDATVENTTDSQVTVTVASFSGFQQPVSLTIPAKGSADIAFRLQVACEGGAEPPTMAATLTVATDGGTAHEVHARVVESGTADQLMGECRERFYGS